VQGRLNQLLDDRKEELRAPETFTAQAIPAFHMQKARPGSIAAKVSKEAKLRFLQIRHEMLLDDNELENLWFVLREFATVDEDPETGEPLEELVDYDRYCQISVRCVGMLGEKALPCFTPSTFLRFKRDSRGRIAILPLFNYLMRKVSLQKTRIYLSYHDSTGEGNLSETDLESYISLMLPSLPCLEDLEDTFKSQYTRIALRKLVFFGDPSRRGKVKIVDLLVSRALSEFLELRQELPQPEDREREAALNNNWFSIASAQRVYNLFLSLDSDMDGLLSPAEFSACAGGGLTEVFRQALFEEHVAAWQAKANLTARRKLKPERMDFSCFLEFHIAWENKKHPASLAYFFKVFDRDHKGFLTPRDIFLFFRAVHTKWIEGGNYELAIDDVKDEIYDMVNPTDIQRLTLADLVACKMGDTVVNILSDITGFWQYDSRESLMQEPEEES